jgi:hypothetical protein
VYSRAVAPNDAGCSRGGAGGTLDVMRILLVSVSVFVGCGSQPQHAARPCPAEPCVAEAREQAAPPPPCETPGCSVTVAVAQPCDIPPCAAVELTCPDGPPCDVGVAISASASGDFASSSFDADSACDGPGCNALADKYLTGNGRPRKPELAVALYARACDTGSSSGCYYLARMYEQGLGAATSRDKARELFERACAAGNAVACKHQR